MGDGDFLYRVKCFFCLSKPSHLFVTQEDINDATAINSGKKKNATEAEKSAARCLMEATHDPETGALRPVLTRLAASSPLKMLTLGGMLAFYHTKCQIMFWQWLHQSVVSYVDYQKDNPSVPKCEVALGYAASTAGAITTALTLHKYFRCKPSIWRRLIPLAAVAVGNAINTAVLKRSAMTDGVLVMKENDAPVGMSKSAGRQAVVGAFLGRLLLLAPALVVTPLVLDSLEQKNKFCRNPRLEAVYAFGLTGVLLFLLSPFIWAHFHEKARAPVLSLEEEIQASPIANLLTE